jgi:RNA polymerase sigma-70 factor (ECF subfamily)
LNLKSSKIIQKEILRFCEGDDQALTIFYIKWLPELYLVAYRYLNNKNDTEDVISECFEKLLKMPTPLRQRKFIEKGISLKALLLVMVKNKCLDHIKINKNRSRILEEIKFTFQNFSKNAADDYFARESVSELMSCLPKQEQTIIELKVKGFDRQEIGKQLNLSPKSVSNSLSKSRTTIKELWKTIL